ncbi:hypothetical protein SAMN04488043_11250 [Thalassovita gelatinovora]|nr:hypothetical protein SAMN04488043_11250 [Thalassovita gelatinovora]
MIQVAIGLHLEHRRDPTCPQLTPKSLFAALDGTGVASRNTVQAFLRELTRVQLVDSVAPKTIRQRAPKVSEKSEKLMQVYIDIHLHALDTIDGADRRAFLQRNPSFLFFVQPEFAKRICRSAAWYDPPETIRCFTNSTSGSSILHDLVLATQALRVDVDDRVWVGTVSAAGLAQRYQVSPAHVARMLSRASELGAIGWSHAGRRGDCWLSAPLCKSYLLWQAEKLSILSYAFKDAVRSFVDNAAPRAMARETQGTAKIATDVS